MSKLVFTSVKAKNGKNGKLEKDGEYYKVRVGAFNAHNESGIFYEFTNDVRELMNDSSDLIRRLNNGALKGEAGHPQPLPGQTMKQYIQRLCRIELKNVAIHIRSIELEETNEREPGASGNKVIVWAWLRPDGPYASMVKAALDDPDTNAAFSVRSIATDRIVNGRTIRTIKILVTWDFVLEPGIRGSNKWKSVGIEDRDLCVIDLDKPNEVAILTKEIKCHLGCGNEDADNVSNNLLNLIEKETKHNDDIVNRW